MKRKIKFFGLTIITASFVFFVLSIPDLVASPTQQERRFNLSLTEQEIGVVLQGLSELPMKTSQPVYSTIMQQAQAQLQPPKAAPVQKDSTKKRQ